MLRVRAFRKDCACVRESERDEQRENVRVYTDRIERLTREAIARLKRPAGLDIMPRLAAAKASFQCTGEGKPASARRA